MHVDKPIWKKSILLKKINFENSSFKIVNVWQKIYRN